MSGLEQVDFVALHSKLKQTVEVDSQANYIQTSATETWQKKKINELRFFDGNFTLKKNKTDNLSVW